MPRNTGEPLPGRQVLTIWARSDKTMPNLSTTGGGTLTRFHVFIIRAVLGAVFAVILSRVFYPDADIVYVAGLGIILVGLAYFVEYLRNRRKQGP